MKQVTPPTEKSKKLVTTLKYLLVAQLVAMALSIMVSSTLFIYMLFCCLFLYLSYTQLDFCSTIVYIFFSGSQLLDLMLTFGTFWQNDISISEYGVVPFVIEVVLTVYIITAIWIVFQAYKEFKAISTGSSGGMYSGLQGSRDQASAENYYGATGIFFF